MSVNKTGIASASKHYQAGEVQPIDLIVSQRLNFCAGSAVKYLCRYERKGTAMQDLLKTKQYVEWLIEEQERIDAGISDSPSCK